MKNKFTGPVFIFIESVATVTRNFTRNPDKKTNKAKLLHALECHSNYPVVETPIVGGIHVVDGMAMIRQVNVNKLKGERTFHNLALVILKSLVNMAKLNSLEEIHFVTDSYRQISIKNSERANRSAIGSQVVKIHGQSLPQQWNKFLSNGENKESCHSTNKVVKYLKNN